MKIVFLSFKSLSSPSKRKKKLNEKNSKTIYVLFFSDMLFIYASPGMLRHDVCLTIAYNLKRNFRIQCMRKHTAIKWFKFDIKLRVLLFYYSVDCPNRNLINVHAKISSKSFFFIYLISLLPTLQYDADM